MRVANVDAGKLMDALLPELEKLCKNAPRYGEVALRAVLADGKVGRICLGVEVLRKIEPEKEPIFTADQSTKGQERGKTSASHSEAEEHGHE